MTPRDPGAATTHEARPSEPTRDRFIPHGSRCEADDSRGGEFGQCGNTATAVIHADGRDRYVCSWHELYWLRREVEALRGRFAASAASPDVRARVPPPLGSGEDDVLREVAKLPSPVHSGILPLTTKHVHYCGWCDPDGLYAVALDKPVNHESSCLWPRAQAAAARPVAPPVAHAEAITRTAEPQVRTYLTPFMLAELKRNHEVVSLDGRYAIIDDLHLLAPKGEAVEAQGAQAKLGSEG